MLSHQSSYIPALTVIHNDDLLTEILLRLPSISLLRFKSVSKRWLSIITDRRFTRLHSLNVAAATGLFIQRSPRLRYSFLPLDDDFHFPIAKDRKAPRISQSCNGLLLCCGVSEGTDLAREYYVYNPTTNGSASIPPIICPNFLDNHGDESILSVHLAFDPSKSSDYKIICLYLTDPMSEDVGIDVYSSGSGVWKSSGEVLNRRLHFENGVFWNGAVNWTCSQGDSLCFDVEKEHSRKFRMPPIPEGRDYRRISYFGESSGHLHLIESFSVCMTNLCVYEMRRDRSSWFVKYQIDVGDVIDTFLEWIPRNSWGYLLRVLSIVRREEDEDEDSSMILLNIPGRVMGYNPGKKTFEKLHDFEHDSDDTEGPLLYGSKDSFQYIQSLFTL